MLYGYGSQKKNGQSTINVGLESKNYKPNGKEKRLVSAETVYINSVKCIKITDELIIDPIHGVLGLLDDRNIEDVDERVIKFTLTLPASFFEPTLVNVEFPAELIPPQKAEVVKVEVPVAINETNTEHVVVTSASPGSNGFIAYLSREIRKFMGKEQSSAESNDSGL